MTTRSKWFGAVLTLGVIISMASAGLATTATHAAGAKPQAHVAKMHVSHANKAAKATCKKATKAKGTVKFSDWEFPASLNPYLDLAAVRVLVTDTMFDGLWTYNNKGHITTLLFQKYPSTKNGLVSKDGKTVTFSIKPGLKWSNGQAMTMADVKFGWQIDMTKTTGPACQGSCDVISKFDVLNATTGRLHLKHSVGPLETVFPFDIWPVKWPSLWPKGNVAKAAKALETASNNFENTSYPVNGPYQATSFVAGDRITLRPNKYYGDKACGGYIKNLIFAGYSDKASMEAAAANHETDVTQDYTPFDVPVLQQHSDAYKIYNTPGFIIEHLEYMLDKQFNGQPNPTANTKVRQALNLGLDKLGLVRSALSISASAAKSVVAYTPWVLTKQLVQPFADKTITGAWDPIKKKYVTPGTASAQADAKKLLSQAGYGNGVTIQAFTTSGNAVRQAQMGVMQASWAKIGVTLTPNYIDPNQFFGGWDANSQLDHGAFQVAMFAFTGGPEPDGLKYEMQPQYIERNQAVHANIDENYAGINDKVITKAYNTAYKNANTKVRAAAYHTIQEQMAKQAYWTPLYYRNAVATVDGKLKGFLNNAAGEDTWNAFSWKPTSS